MKAEPHITEMSKLDMVIHDLADILSRLDKNIPNRQAIIEQTLRSLCDFAISEHLVAPIRAAQDDMAQVELIRRMP